MLLFFVKILLMLAFVFSGCILARFYAKHKILVILSGIVALGGSAYLGKDICVDLNCDKIFSSGFSSNPIKPDEPWVRTKAPPLSLLSDEFKATPFSSIFKFSFDVLSFEEFTKQQKFQAKDMFETKAVYQARYAALKNRFQEYLQQLSNQRQQLIDKYNQAVQTANKDYPIGVITLTDYDAEAGKMSVTLDWQADWIKDNVLTKKDLIQKSTISIPPNKAKALWQSGQEKRLFLKVTAFDNDNEYLSGEAVLVDNGSLWVIDKSFISLSPTDKGKKQLVTLKKQGALIQAGSSFRDRLKDGGFGPNMVKIPAGSFQMGSNKGSSDEKPVHKVSLSAFAIGKYEVTFAEYDKYATAKGKNKPKDRGWGRGNRPVIYVSWNDAVDYAKWLSKQTGYTYRLPTEAEWEYSARAGAKTEYSFGDDASSLGDYAWYDKNSSNKTHPVGEKKPNAWGLHDMHGNLWEWVHDVYDSSYYNSSPRSNPRGPSGGGENGSFRVLRGGAWFFTALLARSAFRFIYSPESRHIYVGFRLVRMIP